VEILVLQSPYESRSLRVRFFVTSLLIFFLYWPVSFFFFAAVVWTSVHPIMFSLLVFALRKYTPFAFFPFPHLVTVQ